MTEKIEITDANFVHAHEGIMMAFSTLSLFDWSELVRARNRCDTIMPITDPTGYHELITSKGAAASHEMAKAARDFVTRIEQIKEEFA